MGKVHVIVSQFGGEVLGTVPAENVDYPGHIHPDNPGEHDAWVHHLVHEQGRKIRVHTLDAADVPALAHGHVCRDGKSISMTHEVGGVSSSLAVVAAQQAMIDRLQAITDRQAKLIEAQEARLQAAEARAAQSKSSEAN